MNRRADGVMGMPFTIIFSIIIIIAVLATAFYVIKIVYESQRCSQAGMFLKELKNSVEQAYEDTYANKTFSQYLPSGITRVCVADLSTEGDTKEEKEMILDLRRYSDEDSNVFLYPPKKVCSEANSKRINYIENKGIYCFYVKDGRANIRIERDYLGNTVRLIENGK